MRIAHVLRRLSFDDWGGTEQVVWNLAKAQSEAGHEVRIFATTALWRGGASDRVLQGGASAPPISRFRPVYPWWPMPKRLVDELDRKGGNPFVPGMGRAIREWRPDVIHCHAMGRIAELCLRTAAKCGAKSVISLHGGGANVPEEEARSLMAPTRGRLPWGKALDIAMGWTRRIPEDFGGIVCVGEDEADIWRRRHPRVIYLPNGVDTRIFEEAATRRDARRGAASRSPTALCVARIDRQKNQMALVEALARNPELSARLVGPVTQPDYLSEISARAAALGVSDRLAVVGPLPPGGRELVSEYAAADVFVLPSRHEPFGIAVLEAWAAGLPVAASGIGGLGRLCASHPGAAATFRPDDPEGIDSAIRAALCGAAEMSANGRRAAAEYDWRRISARAVELYALI